MKKILLTFFAVMCCIMVSAEDFTFGGINYNITGDNTVEVALNFYKFSGPIEIPTIVTNPNDSKTYIVTRIGDEAFLNNPQLTSVNIPESVTSIGNGAFNLCSMLTSINIPSGVTSIGTETFYLCNRLNSITIPSGVTNIGDRAFYQCICLTSITIPSGVESIGNDAFLWCYQLASITVAKENTKYESPDNCNAIIEKSTHTLLLGCMNTIIPNTVTSIANNAFNDVDLTSVTIPEGVTRIGDKAFESCDSLTEICVLATTPPTLGVDAFKDVSTDIPVYVPDVETYKNNGWGGFANLIKGKDLPTVKEEAIAEINVAIEGVSYADILAIANQAKTDIKDATTAGTVNTIKTLALAKINAMKDINAAIEGVSYADILAIANQAKTDIKDATTAGTINSIKTQTLADLAIPLKYYNSGKDDALGALGTPQTDCPAVKVTKDDKVVILYAPDAVEMIKVPANE